MGSATKFGFGAIFELTPTSSGWTESVLYRFEDLIDGAVPQASLTLDGVGNFYGTTWAGGNGPCFYSDLYNGCGTVFSGLSPTTVYAFDGPVNATSGGPVAPVTFDSQGNIYGTSIGDGMYQSGNVFKLSADQHVYTSLHDFNGSDGVSPMSNVVFDASGNMYGTAYGGGTSMNCPFTCGVIWEITP